jgi:SAM-dependent methyltransferase
VHVLEASKEAIMDVTRRDDDGQNALWNGPAGRGWVDVQDLVDEVLKPFEDLLVEAVSAEARAGSPLRVLDVGCGTGGTTLAVARSLGASGTSTGIDISEPMIASARARAERAGTAVTFLVDDAQAHPFEPASFDMIISRFGVMFFADPVQAFANLRRAARDGALLRFIAWRTAAENPFMTTAERAAAPLLPDLPARRPDAPGQFAFADSRRVHSILAQTGWSDIDIRPIDVPCALPRDELAHYLTRLGPVGRILQDADDHTRNQVMAAVLPAFEAYIQGPEVRFLSACWLADARASG